MDVLADTRTNARRRGDAVSAFADIPWYLLTICIALAAAVVVGYFFAFRYVKRDWDDRSP
jgi:hypothetical protein